MTHTPEQLAGMTPAEIDSALAPLAHRLAELRARRWSHLDAAREYGRTAQQRPALRTRYEQRAAEEEAKAADLVGPIELVDAQCAPYHAEYARRPWPRVFWCTANGGHAHRSLSCSTLRITTRMVWLPEMSGQTEEELVAAAGESACTICYPSAPVDVLARPSTLAPAVAEREAAAARKQQRDQEKAERAAVAAAKGITAPDGGRLVVDGWEVKSETTARNNYVAAAAEAADHAEGVTSYGPRPDLAARYGGHAEQLLAALAHKHGRTIEEERAELAGKVTARRKKDARERAKWAHLHG